MCDSSVARPRARPCAAAGALLLLAGAALAGCGQKGPLFLPGEAPAAASTPVYAPVSTPVPLPPAGIASAPLRP